ncbi:MULTISPECIES: J domain-containing protein [Pseudomonas]|uniref:J domain-containing protein n=1 Tax=Pseudomonas TaxID=286 RepID=UPI002159171F|nr:MULTISPECIES: J domain-containing protein [Pseudomonas]
MTCWEVLDLPPDADSRTIKRTYAALLKKTRPDADPEGFQRLREAYEAAMSGQESALDDAFAATAVEMAAPEPVDATLPQRYQQALAQGNGPAFEVALLERCISDDTVSDEERRWAFDTFHWLSAWSCLRNGWMP